MGVTNPVPTVRDEIENLLCRYARGFDENDPALLAECFTVDAELHSGEPIRGRDEIRATLAERRQMRADAGQLPRHLNSNIAIEMCAEDEAHVHSYFALLITSRDGGVTLEVVGTYEDRIVRQGTRWLIASRRTTRDAFG